MLVKSSSSISQYGQSVFEKNTTGCWLIRSWMVDAMMSYKYIGACNPYIGSTSLTPSS